MYVVKNEGSWVLFTKSNYLLNRALLNRGLGVLLNGFQNFGMNVDKITPLIIEFYHNEDSS